MEKKTYGSGLRLDLTLNAILVAAAFTFVGLTAFVPNAPSAAAPTSASSNT